MLPAKLSHSKQRVIVHFHGLKDCPPVTTTFRANKEIAGCEETQICYGGAISHSSERKNTTETNIVLIDCVLSTTEVTIIKLSS